jgi:hypothetical protein
MGAGAISLLYRLFLLPNIRVRWLDGGVLVKFAVGAMRMNRQNDSINDTLFRLFLLPNIRVRWLGGGVLVKFAVGVHSFMQIKVQTMLDKC